MNSRLTAAAVLALAMGATACSAHSKPGASSPSPTPESTLSADALLPLVNSAYGSFFKSGTPQERARYLEDGTALIPELTLLGKDPGANMLRANVVTVSPVDPTHADLTYNLTAPRGVPVLKGANGAAVRVDGKWLVAKATFCQLVQLSHPKDAQANCS